MTLTEMFGKGNEPTYEQIKNIIKNRKDYLPHSKKYKYL